MKTVLHCYNCGNENSYRKIKPIDDALKQAWDLSEKLTSLFNRREGYICENCGVNVRAQGLAKAIIDSKFGLGAKSLIEWVDLANKKKLKVCELNACHELHKTLIKLKNLTYAEYGTSSEENIEGLSYKSNIFDIVLHSETLEHVNDPSRAMDECRRVINANGIVLFTTPIIWGRKTTRRAKIQNGKQTNLLPPSYHGQATEDYKVFFEYGNDIDQLLEVDVCYSDPSNQNFVFISPKQGKKIKPSKKLSLKLTERLMVKKEAI